MTDPEPSPTFYNPYAFAFDTEVAIALLADMQIRKAIDRGAFDDLPGSGEPLDLPEPHDPDWWLKSLLQREHLALLPSSIQLRKEDAALDDNLDRLPNEAAVRHEVDEFNQRVIRARYELPAGPPLTTMSRDPEATVSAWAERRAQRVEARATSRPETPADDRRRRRLFRRRDRKR